MTNAITREYVEGLLKKLTLEELAELAIALVAPRGSGILIKEDNTKPVFIAKTEEEAAWVNEYWRSIFGGITSGEATNKVRKFREAEELDGSFFNMRKH